MPSASVVRLASAMESPTAATNRVAPVEFAARARPPLTEQVNVIAPLPVETDVSPASMVVPTTQKVLSVVV